MDDCITVETGAEESWKTAELPRVRHSTAHRRKLRRKRDKSTGVTLGMSSADPDRHLQHLRANLQRNEIPFNRFFTSAHGELEQPSVSSWDTYERNAYHHAVFHEFRGVHDQLGPARCERGGLHVSVRHSHKKDSA